MNWKKLQQKLNDPEYVRSMIDPEKIIIAYAKVRELQKFQPKSIEPQETLKDEYPF